MAASLWLLSLAYAQPYTTTRRKKASRQQASYAHCSVVRARQVLPLTQIWSGAVAVGQKTNLLTAAMICGLGGAGWPGADPHAEGAQTTVVAPALG